MKKGFSLAEIVVATGILSVIIVGFSMVMNSSYKVFYYSRNELDSISKAAAIMRDFERTTRGAGANDTSFDASVDELTFYAYQKSDRSYPVPPSKIRYYFAGDILNKSVTAPVGSSSPYTYPSGNTTTTAFAGTILTHNIFSYYDGEDGETIDAGKIRMIKIDVTVSSKAPAPDAEATTTVELRNKKDNL